MTGDVVDEIRFQLPMRIGQRYGRLPDGMLDAAHMSNKTRVRMKINIQTEGVINSVQSPSHPTLTLSSHSTHRSLSSRRRTTAHYSSSEYLNEDFVL